MKNVHSFLHEWGWADFQGQDPGNGGAIPASLVRHYNIATAGAETRTLPDPPRSGILLALNMTVHVGDCVITAASAINAAGNTIITLNSIGDFVLLMSRKTSTGSGFAWVVITNNGAVLS